MAKMWLIRPVGHPRVSGTKLDENWSATTDTGKYFT